MPPSLVAALINAAERRWGLAGDVEITLEANPSSVETARFADLAAAGVNRLSLGIQSFDDAALRFLGRAHDAGEGFAALNIAQRQFRRVSFDLIYARPDQGEAAWAEELRRALAFGTGHLSLYQLTIEPGTRFESDVRKGQFTLPDNDMAAGLYGMTQDMTAAAGLPAYEISNHARPGEESRHNLTYWRYGDYIGIGPGAHGRRLAHATQRHRKPENFLSAIGRNRHGIAAEDALPPVERAMEALLMGLRLSEGVDLNRLAARTGIAPDAMIDRAGAERLAKLGLLSIEGPRLAVLPAGFLLLDSILPEIVRVEPDGKDD